MGVYLAWTSYEGVDADELQGPWEEVRVVAPGLVLVESKDRLSPVYHALKWCLPEGAALMVTPVVERPKLKGLNAGTTTWLRERVETQDELDGEG